MPGNEKGWTWKSAYCVEAGEATFGQATGEEGPNPAARLRVASEGRPRSRALYGVRLFSATKAPPLRSQRRRMSVAKRTPVFSP